MEKSDTCEITQPTAVSEDGDHCANIARTCEGIVTPVAQGSSQDVPRGGVYFIRSGDRIKIGFSTNPLERFRQIQTSSSDALELLAFLPGTYADEGTMHRIFWSLHVRGEWFQNHPAILRYIKQRTGGANPIPYARLKHIRDAHLMSELTDLAAKADKPQ